MNLTTEATDKFAHVLDQLPPRLIRGGEVHSKPILRAVDAWDWGHGSLVLLGGTGIGKTTAAVALVCRLVSDAAVAPPGSWRAHAAHSILFLTAQRMAHVRKESGLGSGLPFDLYRACRVRLLIIDDLGAEPAYDTDIGAVLDDRYANGRPVVVTSGLSKDKLAARYSDAFLRRLKETGTRPAVIVEDFKTKAEAAA